MKVRKIKYHLAKVVISATYDTKSNEGYIVTETWLPKHGSGKMEVYDYKYVANSLEHAIELAQKRIAKAQGKP